MDSDHAYHLPWVQIVALAAHHSMADSLIVTTSSK
jgi:hypothetical protein